jgi:putative restriction endonuclease
MNVHEFLHDDAWDAPFFKKLAHNDTGRAVGHQGGIVLPKDLRQFFPTLDETLTSQVVPTIDRYLQAEIFVGMAHVEDRTIRYQLQTWGGTRRAESRLTEGLVTLRRDAKAGDLLLIQRRADALDRYRLILIRQESPEFAQVDKFARSRRWGALYPERVPTDESDLSQANREIEKLLTEPFVPIRPSIERAESRQMRIARSTVFRERVRTEYRHRCAVSGIGLATPSKLHEVESAHVIPLSERGSDDPRNGLALTKTLHWAFDRGLFGIMDDRRVYVPGQVKSIKSNAFILEYEGIRVADPVIKHHRVHMEAFRWHMEHRVRQWEAGTRHPAT